LKEPQAAVLSASASDLFIICFSFKLRLRICKMGCMNFGQQMTAVVEQGKEDFHI
jgi:hypothetical protein